MKLTLIILQFFFTLSLFAQGTKDPTETVKKMVGFIRYAKNEKALSFIDTATFSKNLLKKDYDSLKPEDKEGLESAVKEFITKKAFPKAAEYFTKIDLNYEKSKINGKEARVPSSLLYRGSEKIQFSWVLTEKDGKYLVTDFYNDGKLASETNGSKIKPIFDKDGIAKVIEAMKAAANK
ncbi:MAG: ABC transporter substrate-binding protein [Leptospiraceae bacterium]|nr:ABC transporter substrate-binding protein [Leptospiraceae bacterium]